MLDGAGTDARPCFPESNGVVVTSGDEEDGESVLLCGLLGGLGGLSGCVLGVNFSGAGGW